MECSGCKSENRNEARFCKNCGLELKFSCPKCKNLLSPDCKFCDKCGHDLSKPFVSKESLESSPQPDLPPDTSDPTVLREGERCHATIVFSDLSGYTAMNEQLDPEEIEAIMSRIKMEAVKIVEHHEGIEIGRAHV